MTEQNPDRKGFTLRANHLLQSYGDEDAVELEDGSTMSGAKFNRFQAAVVERLGKTEQGNAVLAFLRGEGPEPEPIFTLKSEDLVGGKIARRAFLGTSDVDVADVDPIAGVLLNMFFPENENKK